MIRLPLNAIMPLMPMAFVALTACSGHRAPESEPEPTAARDTLTRAVRGGRIVIDRAARRPGEILPFDSALMARAASVRAEPASITMWVGDTVSSSMIRVIVLDQNGAPLGFLSLRDARLEPGAASLARRGTAVSRGGAEVAEARAAGEGGPPVIVGRHAGESVLELRVPRGLWRGHSAPRPVASVRITVLAERSP